MIKQHNFHTDDIPKEVWYVWVVQYTTENLNKETIDYCQEIMNKYPQYFETKK